MKNFQKNYKHLKLFLNSLLIILSILTAISFLVIGKVNYLNLLVFSASFSLLIVLLAFIQERIRNFLETRILITFLTITLLTFILTNQNYKILDTIFGSEEFSKNVFENNIFIAKQIGMPLIYERYKSAEETFNEKLKEFNNSIDYLELKIHEETNKIRAQLNLNVLSFDEELRNIARYHSKDMAINNYFDHISPDGETLKDRFIKFNFTCKIVVDNYVYEGAENLFLGYIYKSYSYEKLTHRILRYDFYGIDEFAREVVKSWYESEGHRKNMLFEYWKKEGIGVFITSEGKVYVTQVFC